MTRLALPAPYSELDVVEAYDAIPTLTPDCLAVVFRVVCKEYHTTKERLLGPRRDPHTAMARQVAMYLIRHNLRLSFPAIGKHLNRHHGTIIHGCARIERRITEVPAYASRIRALEAGLRNGEQPK